MTKFVRLSVLVTYLIFSSLAQAQAPPLDKSLSFFSGEWAGIGTQGKYCYMSLSADGSGLVLLDAGSGDWLGARIEWQNRLQSLHISKSTPLSFSAEKRIMPLKNFELRTGFNQSMTLTWSKTSSDSCELQKVAILEQKILHARNAFKAVFSTHSAEKK